MRSASSSTYGRQSLKQHSFASQVKSIFTKAGSQSLNEEASRNQKITTKEGTSGPMDNILRRSLSLEDEINFKNYVSLDESLTSRQRIILAISSSDIGDFMKTLKSPDQIENYALSCIGRELQKISFLPTSEEVDLLYAMIKETVVEKCTLITSFLESYSMEQLETPLSNWHFSIIELMTRLIQYYLEDTSRVQFCCQLISVLGQLNGNLECMEKCGVIPIVLGAMTAHLTSPGVQEYGALILDGMISAASYDDIEKILLKTSAVDILMNAIKKHVRDSLVQNNVLRCLGSLIICYKNRVIVAMENSKLPLSIRQASITAYLDILSYVELNALPVVKDIQKQWRGFLTIQMSAIRFISFYESSTGSHEFDNLCTQAMNLETRQPTSILKTGLKEDQSSSMALPLISKKRVSFPFASISLDDSNIPIKTNTHFDRVSDEKEIKSIEDIESSEMCQENLPVFDYISPKTLNFENFETLHEDNSQDNSQLQKQNLMSLMNTSDILDTTNNFVLNDNLLAENYDALT